MVLNTSYSKLIGLEANKNLKNDINDSVAIMAGASISNFSDNGASLAIADNLRTEVTALNRSVRNGNSAIALARLADKAMGEQSNILNIIKEKLIQANTDTTSDKGRESLGKEIYKLLEQIDNIAKDTNYNKNYVLQASNDDNSATFEMKFLLSDISHETVDLISDNIQANTLGYDLDELKDFLESNILTKDMAASNQEKVDNALNILNTFRSEYGSTALQIESSVRTLMTQATNLSNAESVLRDIDYAKESSNFSKKSLNLEANTFAMAQANARQANVVEAIDL